MHIHTEYTLHTCEWRGEAFQFSICEGLSFFLFSLSRRRNGHKKETFGVEGLIRKPDLVEVRRPTTEETES